MEGTPAAATAQQRRRCGLEKARIRGLRWPFLLQRRRGGLHDGWTTRWLWDSGGGGIVRNTSGGDRTKEQRWRLRDQQSCGNTASIRRQRRRGSEAYDGPSYSNDDAAGFTMAGRPDGFGTAAAVVSSETPPAATERRNNGGDFEISNLAAIRHRSGGRNSSSCDGSATASVWARDGEDQRPMMALSTPTTARWASRWLDGPMALGQRRRWYRQKHLRRRPNEGTMVATLRSAILRQYGIDPAAGFQVPTFHPSPSSSFVQTSNLRSAVAGRKALPSFFLLRFFIPISSNLKLLRMAAFMALMLLLVEATSSYIYCNILLQEAADACFDAQRGDSLIVTNVCLMMEHV
ncbi:hypothetical protein LINPERHAP2_LOCUS3176 [Linum perenne]